MNRVPLLCSILVLAMGAGVSGCNYENEEDLYPMNFCDTTNVGYSSTVLPIIQANCAIPGCHVSGGTGTGNFTTYAGLKGQVTNGRLIPSIEQASNAAAMPPSGKLSDCEIAKIVIWVQQGAPLN